MRRSVALALALSLPVAALATAPAAALENLTGDWYGRWKCTGLHAGEPRKPAEWSSVEMHVLDDEAGVVVSLNSVPLYGYAVTDASKPSTGIFTGVTCGNMNTDGYGLMAHFEVKTKAGEVRATMKGELIQMSRASAHAVRCKFTATRVHLDLQPIFFPPACVGNEGP
jgi:hypothetical protein